ncbi:hypothetical protein MTO96_033992 [Rhipicephalus appendiculatus]
MDYLVEFAKTVIALPDDLQGLSTKFEWRAACSSRIVLALIPLNFWNVSELGSNALPITTPLVTFVSEASLALSCDTYPVVAECAGLFKLLVHGLSYNFSGLRSRERQG